MQRCNLCPWFSSTPTCIRCSERVDSARVSILRRLVLPYAAQLQQFAESDMGIPISQEQTSAPLPKPAKTGEVATGGKDGIKAASLLSVAKDQGADVLRRITQTAVTRMLASGRTQAGLYTPAERQALAETLAGVTASADLLGRSRIQERKTTIETRRVKRFSERSTGFIAFADPIAPMAPEKAVEYFRGLVPTLGTDPQRFGADQRRKAFTLAVATERTLLAKVQSIIQQGLESGESTTGLARKTQEILDAAGVSRSNPQYSEMVVRTNMMDAYNQGQTAEMQELGDFFPVWRYDGIRDGREGDDHRPHFGKYYPASASFATVRGKRPYNCRCTMTPIDQYEWEDLVAKGARVESGYGAVEKPKAVKQAKGKAPKAAPSVPTVRAPEPVQTPAPVRAQPESLLTVKPDPTYTPPAKGLDWSLETGAPTQAQQSTLAKILGRKSQDVASDLAALTGAPPGSKIGMEEMSEGLLGRTQTQIVVESPAFRAVRTLSRDNKTGELTIYNDEIQVLEKGKGLGTQIFSTQVKEAIKMGVSKIECVAEGRLGHPKYVGYSTWPKLGYDGPIPAKVRAKLPAEYADAQSVLDLHALPGGAEWWRVNGSTFRGTFDLREGSRSRAVLAAYLQSKGVSFAESNPSAEAEDIQLSLEEQTALDRLWQRIATEGWAAIGL